VDLAAGLADHTHGDSGVRGTSIVPPWPRNVNPSAEDRGAHGDLRPWTPPVRWH
jgi:hypothetical protein